jgi:autotransporter translocation and assembly factor TamB
VPAVAAYPESAAVDTHAVGSLERFTADWTLASHAGNGKGRVSGGLQDDVLRLKGDVSAKGFKVAEWFRAPELPPAVDVTSTYDLEVPLEDPQRLRVTFDGAVPAARIADLDFRSLRAKGSYSSGTVSGRGSAIFYGASFAGTGQWNKDSGRYSGEGTFDRVDLLRLPAHLKAPRLESQLAGTARFEGRGASVFVETALTPSTIVGATLDEGFVASVDTRGQEISYSARGRVTGLDPERLTPLVDNPPDVWKRALGRVDAQVSAAGTGSSLATLHLTSDMHIERAELPGLSLENSDVTVTLNERALQLALETWSIRVAENPLGYRTGPLEAVGAGKAAMRLPDVSGPIRWEDASGEAHLNLTSVSGRGLALTSATVDAALSAGLLTIQRFDATGQRLNARAAGTVALAGESQSNATFYVSAEDLSIFNELAQRPLSGGGSVEGTLKGAARTPLVAATVKLRELEAETASSLTLNGTFSATLPEWDVANAVGSADATAAFVKVSGVELDEVVAKVGFDRGTLTVDAKLAQGARAFDIGGEVVPHPDHREVHFRRMIFTAGATTWTLPDGADAVVQYGESRIAVKGLHFQSGAAAIDVAGMIGEGATEPLTITATGVAVEDLNQMALGTHDIRGRLDGRAVVSGSTKAPTVQANLTVANGVVEGLAFGALTAELGYQQDTIALDVLLDAGPHGSLTAVGAIPYARGTPARPLRPYDVTVRSTSLELGFFQPLTTLVENLRGTARMDVRVTGESGAPSFNGNVALVDASFLAPATGIAYARMNADLVLDGQQVVVNRFRVEDDDGHPATIEGALQVPGVGDADTFEIILHAEQFHLLKNQFGEVAVTADLQALGTLQTPLVSGTVRVDRGRIEATDLLDRLTASGYRTSPTELPSETPAQTSASTPFERASLSVTLDMPGNVVIRGRDLRTRGGPIGFGDVNVTIDGALSIAKETAAPLTLVGRVDVVRGQYQFQGRAFTIVRGSELQFQGTPSNPALDVTAERTISGVTAQVKVTGNLSQPAITLSSTPPLEEGDVLSLIVFNQTMNELPGEERVSLAARAGAMAAGAIATPLADSVARALDLDLFEIRPSDQGASVRVGRQVSDRLFLGFAQDFGRDDLSQLSFEYRLTRIISVVTSIAHGTSVESARRQAQQAGIDLIFDLR